MIQPLAETDVASVKSTLQQSRQLLARLPALSTAEGLTDRELTAIYVLRAVVNDIYFNVAMDSTVVLPEKPDTQYELLMGHMAHIVRSLGRFLQDVLREENSTNPLVDCVGSLVRLLASLDGTPAATEKENSR